MSEHPKNLRTFLKEFAELIADEAERNPKFAEELLHFFKLTPALKPEKKQEKKLEESIPDLYLIFYQEGKEKLNYILNKFSISKLKSIIEEYKIEVSQEVRKSKKKEPLIQIICEQVEFRENRGNVFRNYQIE
jgi:hypothetical protein